MSYDPYIFSFTGLFSLYQRTRLSSLSKSGKFMAPFGAAFSAYAIVAAKTTAAQKKRVAAGPATEAPAEEATA